MIFLHVKAGQPAKIGTQTFCLSLLVPIARERTSWVEEQDLADADRVGRNVCIEAGRVQGCGTNQPSGKLQREAFLSTQEKL